jgi:hypothetical protein
VTEHRPAPLSRGSGRVGATSREGNQTVKKFNITSVATCMTAFLHLKDPKTEEPFFVDNDGNPEPVGITFFGPGSPEYEAADARRTNRSLLRNKRKIELTADILRADAIQHLADITASFDNLEYPPAGNATGVELYKALYSDREYGWVVTQATPFNNDWGNFSKASATS